VRESGFTLLGLQAGPSFGTPRDLRRIGWISRSPWVPVVLLAPWLRSAGIEEHRPGFLSR
jgi:hypothetical protein